MAVVLAAALILAATVIYTVYELRAVQLRILTGEFSAAIQHDTEKIEGAVCNLQTAFVAICV